MPVVFRNNATTTLASAITASATSIALKTGDGAKFPAPTSDDWFPVTLIKADNTNEVVRCTARSGDVITVVRAQEGTSGQAFSAGDRVELRLTNAAIGEFMQQSEFSAFIKTLFDDASAEAARNTLGLGAAATAAVTTSSTDSTAGRLTKVGDFGLGGYSPARYGGDLNTILETGWRAIDSTATNAPLAGQGLCVTGMWDNASGGWQVFSQLATNREWVRFRANSIWAGWVERLSTGNTLQIGLTAESARTALALGSAATASVTTGINDLTAGRIPKNGDKQICTAWVSLNGTGTIAVIDSMNVSSVSDLGTGNYRVNFASAMANALYSPVINAKPDGSGTGNSLVSIPSGGKTAGTLQFVAGNGSGVLADHAYIDVHVFGGK